MADRRFGSLVMEDAGEGRAVVCVHGLGGSSNSFEPLMPALEGCRVVRPDTPGAGRSPVRAGLDTMTALCRALTDALSGAKVRRAVIVAHSMGTLIAQRMAVTAPHRVEALVLFGALTEPPEAARAALRERAEAAERHGMAGIASAVAEASLSTRSRTDAPATQAFVRESLMRQDPRGYAVHCRALARAERYPPMKIRVPVRLVTGAEDRVAPPAMAEALHRALPFSRLTILPGVGHWPMLEAPAAARAAVAQTLADLAEADHPQGEGAEP